MTSATDIRYEVFAQEYVVSLNGTQAAIKAGYSPHTADRTASALLRHPKVLRLVEKHTRPKMAELDITVDRTLRTVAAIAFGDRTALWDEDPVTGVRTLKPFREMTEAERVLVESVEFEKETLGDDLVFRHKTKMKSPERLKALELLMKYQGLLPTSGKIRLSVDARTQSVNVLALAGLTREEIFRIAQLPDEE